LLVEYVELQLLPDTQLVKHGSPTFPRAAGLQIPVAGLVVAPGWRIFKQTTGSPAHSSAFSQDASGAMVPVKISRHAGSI
jgi:hypothetical protein